MHLPRTVVKNGVPWIDFTTSSCFAALALAKLPSAADGSFANASAAKQLEVVKSIQGTPFFTTVRGKCITSLYDNDMAYATFGYQGASYDKGGYIMRGFQDIKWLPD